MAAGEQFYGISEHAGGDGLWLYAAKAAGRNRVVWSDPPKARYFAKG